MERATLGIKLDGQRLRDLRKRRAESVSTVARRVGISVQYLSFIERGQRNPLPEVFGRICDALELGDADRDELRADDDERPAKVRIPAARKAVA